MALVFCDGFDHYVGLDILKKWTGMVTGNATQTLCAPVYARPPGGQGLNITLSNSAYGPFKALPAAYSTFVSGFNIFVASGGATGSPMWAVFDSAVGVGTNYQLALTLDGSGHLRVGTGNNAGTQLAVSTNAMSVNTWYHVEIKATIHNTAGAYEVRVNGSSTGWIPAATNKNTRGQSTNNQIDIVALLNNGSASTQLDDFYFLSSAAPNNDFLGPQKILTAYPVAAGNYAQWVGNYASNFANVNETTGDGDSTFNQSATAGQIDTFDFSDVPAGMIAAIQHVIEARQDAGVPRTIATFERSGGGADHVGTSFVLAGSHLFLTDPRDVDPDTSAAWDVDLFNGNEYGYKEVS